MTGTVTVCFQLGVLLLSAYREGALSRLLSRPGNVSCWVLVPRYLHAVILRFYRVVYIAIRVAENCKL